MRSMRQALYTDCSQCHAQVHGSDLISETLLRKRVHTMIVLARRHAAPGRDWPCHRHGRRGCLASRAEPAGCPRQRSRDRHAGSPGHVATAFQAVATARRRPSCGERVIRRGRIACFDRSSSLGRSRNSSRGDGGESTRRQGRERVAASGDWPGRPDDAAGRLVGHRHRRLAEHDRRVSGPRLVAVLGLGSLWGPTACGPPTFSLTGTDNETTHAVWDYAGPGLRANVDYERFRHSLSPDPLANFPQAVADPANPGSYLPVSGEFVAEDLNAGEDYAIRVQQLKAKFQGELTDKVRWRLNVWGLRKSGERQVTGLSDCFDHPQIPGDARQCHVLSRRQQIDWLTMELEPGVEGKWGPVTVSYSRPMRSFNQNDQSLTRLYNSLPGDLLRARPCRPNWAARPIPTAPTTPTPSCRRTSPRSTNSRSASK